jgi:hypothetical protein
MITEAKPSQSLGKRHETKSMREIGDMVVMQYAEVILSRLTTHIGENPTLMKTNYLSMVRTFFTSINEYRSYSPEEYSNMVGFDIRKCNEDITKEESKKTAEFLTDGLRKLLENIADKPENELQKREKEILRKFNLLKTTNNTSSAIKGIVNLSHSVATTSLFRPKESFFSVNRHPHKDSVKIKILILIKEGELSDHEIARKFKCRLGEVEEIRDNYILDENSNLILKNQKDNNHV